ncbi:glycosyltransferase involved in cell wall biosynthesis [Neolewinella xylanilytica]|uniref:Glycosyltransferase involved in cell wall biosynthesis n=1 Tax=Neolewinella xylanilytica TaxID=1514080 RepID=A0A2S6I7P5_9BACT|nr:glycosyltransferase family 4 protein [Neolewinella xylanilytica]PPK87521.1 glycosyltransferase involved in cell wall biosynthesis [Neolewinella xylanilytica]
MKILISTPVFKPMVGGMETLANNFAVHFTERGHEVTLVTPIPYAGTDDEDYRIVRQPSFREFYRLAKQTDLIFSNGASLYAAPYAMLTGKPMVMRHTGYQVACIDGAGWYDGKIAPLRPFPSFLFHLKNGKLPATLRGIVKVAALRTFAKRFVAANIAISDWMKRRHPLPNQVRIHNPFPISKFVGGRNESGVYDYDFFFLGRLVTEKGVNLLIDAFTTVQERSDNRYRLCIIGDGPERPRLEKMVHSAVQNAFVTFTGMLTKQALVDQMKACKIAVLPSTWEEPFGGAASEILAAGKNVIVSRDGALSEIVADAGLTFPNNDSAALADAMQRLVEDEDLQKTHRKNAEVRLRAFSEDDLIDQYISLFDRLLAKN